jgi:hypothetical protein
MVFQKDRKRFGQTVTQNAQPNRERTMVILFVPKPVGMFLLGVGLVALARNSREIDMGFTSVNMCYPMSVIPETGGSALNPVYAATSPSDIVRFNTTEKMLLSIAFLQTIL